VISTAAAAGVALGIAGAYWLKASSNRSRADEVQQDLPDGCLSPMGAYATACNALSTLRLDSVDSALMSRRFLIAAGVLGAASLSTFLLWPAGSSTPQLSAMIGYQAARVTISGTF